MVEYIVYRDGKMVELKCMKGCGATIGKRKDDKDKFVHWSSYRTWPVVLQDGSYQNILVCVDCVSLCTEADFPNFIESSRWGWKQDLICRNGMSPENAEKMVNEYADKKTIVKKFGA